MICAIHGFTGSPRVWDGIGDDNHCLSLTLLGHGRDRWASAATSWDQEVETLAASLPDRGVRLVGYSLGARIALAIALRYPARVSRLLLIGGSPGLRDAQQRADRRRDDAQWSALLRTRGIGAFVDAWQAMPLWDSQRSQLASVLEGQRQQRLAHDPEQLALALDSLGTGAMPDLWPELDRLTMPVHLLTGSLDAKYAAIAAAMADRIANATLHAMDGCGHNPVLERPAQLHQFIKEHF